MYHVYLEYFQTKMFNYGINYIIIIFIQCTSIVATNPNFNANVYATMVEKKCDTKTVIDITANRSVAQRIEIAESYRLLHQKVKYKSASILSSPRESKRSSKLVVVRRDITRNV